ncbi:MAG: sensor histidine kinase [Actinomycetota bacterium]|nr:sensor histidine kinase [Actinomycetota bacterium]
MRDRQLLRLSGAARLFVLLAIVATLVAETINLSPEDDPADHVRLTLAVCLTLAAIWGLGQIAAWRPRLRTTLSRTEEAALVGLVCAFALGESTAPLIALTVPPFVAGLYDGLRGAARALSAQLIAIVPVVFVFDTHLFRDQPEVGLALFAWAIAGVGFALIAIFIRSTAIADDDELAPYRHAQDLLRQLIDISGGLSSGLDVNTTAGSMLSTVGDQLPVSATALYVPRGETLTSVIGRAAEAPDDLLLCEALAVDAWATTKTVIAGNAFAFPVGERAIIGGVLSGRVDLETIDLSAVIEQAIGLLEPDAVRLDTALLFSEFRDSATADERRRLAREMHDGVAQDIASLGYLVDAVAAKPESPRQAEQLQVLRERISHVVAEVRQSVLTLRTSVGENESLGAAISSVARHLSEVSGIPIHVTLDEHTTRLRPAVEAELYRISQEAMNNAIKHAQATAITVHCQVHAPAASITIADDGRGMQQARSDSHGLKIMQERARLIDADLTFDTNREGGLAVRVRIAGDEPGNLDPNDDPHEKVS